MYVCVYVCVCVRVRMRVYVCVRVRIRVYVCVCVCTALIASTKVVITSGLQKARTVARVERDLSHQYSLNFPRAV